MKIVIRKQVFETNRSSTHAISYTKELDEKDDYSYKLKSPWSRLLLLKALTNASGPNDNMDKLYFAAQDVFCERENINKDDLINYLAAKAEKELGKDKNWVRTCYNIETENLCQCFYSEGTLDFCSCGYDSSRLISELKDQNKIKDDYYELAFKFLYGENSIFIKEDWNGFVRLNERKEI